MELTERVQTALQASVVFLDIVGYSLHDVAAQYQVKKLFNADVAYALAPVAQDGRLLLDTGDGAALCFFGPPTDALTCTTRLIARLDAEAASRTVPFAVRTGINVGAVRVIRDMNGQLNVIGDAINDGQRIMSFADAGQVLASQAFHDAVRDAADRSGASFEYVGTRADKHGKAHVLYRVSVAATQAGSTRVVRTSHRVDPSVPGAAAPVPSTPPAKEETAQRAAPASVARSSDAGWPRGVLVTVRAQFERYLNRSADDLMRQAAAEAADIDGLYAMLATHLASDHDRTAFLEGKAVILRMLPQHGTSKSGGGVPKAPAPPVATQVWTPSRELLDSTTVRLARYLGTTASVLVHREAQRATSESDLVLRLAAELKSDEDQINFMDDVRGTSRRV